MNRRFLLIAALIAASLLASGLLLLDFPLAHWIRDSGLANAKFFTAGLGVLDMLLGLRVSYWLAAAVLIPLGLLGIVFAAFIRLPRGLAPALLVAGMTQALTIGLMMLGKNGFGRLRPTEFFESGDWTSLWFVGGGSFPSGHASFYFGLFLPLAAAAPKAWQRATLVAIPVFVAAARLDMLRHFLSDVAASALIAACVALLLNPLMQRWQPRSHPA
ncbi:phosphatase PAP2 family protein [Dokdonella sp.]|uniref:phosphatase PAP2 family protein n=1 Tax=Dokdonella sp. TaxID=2291710 RepID=UPI003C52DFED